MNITHLSVLKAFYLPRRRHRTAPQLSGRRWRAGVAVGEGEQRGATANGCLCLSDGDDGGGASVRVEWFLSAACHHHHRHTAAEGKKSFARHTHARTYTRDIGHFRMFMNMSHAFNTEGVCDY